MSQIGGWPGYFLFTGIARGLSDLRQHRKMTCESGQQNQNQTLNLLHSLQIKGIKVKIP
jgi:hypothetical protein